MDMLFGPAFPGLALAAVLVLLLIGALLRLIVRKRTNP